MATEVQPVGGFQQVELSNNASQWRRLTRAATAVALLTAPAVVVWLNQTQGWSWLWSIVAALALVVCFRGVIDILFHRLILRPSLFGLESQAPLEHVDHERPNPGSLSCGPQPWLALGPAFDEDAVVTAGNPERLVEEVVIRAAEDDLERRRCPARVARRLPVDDAAGWPDVPVALRGDDRHGDVDDRTLDMAGGSELRERRDRPSSRVDLVASGSRAPRPGPVLRVEAAARVAGQAEAREVHFAAQRHAEPFTLPLFATPIRSRTAPRPDPSAAPRRARPSRR